MTTLFDALLETARIAGVLKSGAATSLGSTTTLVDAGRREQDDYYNYGTLFLPATSATKLVTDFVQTTGTITFSAALSSAVASGTRYSVTNVGKEMLIQAVNAALNYMGEYTVIDETLDVTANTTEYTLPSGVTNVKRIELYVTQSAPYGFTPVMTWRENSGKIYLPYELNQSAGNTVRIYYNKFHDDVDADSDVILDIFNLKRLAWTAAYMFMLQRLQYSGNYDTREEMLLSMFSNQAQRLAVAFPVSRIERDPNLARY